MLANNALPIAGLQGRFSDRGEFCDERQNERVSHDVMREREFFRDLLVDVLEVGRYEGDFLSG